MINKNVLVEQISIVDIQAKEVFDKISDFSTLLEALLKIWLGHLSINIILLSNCTLVYDDIGSKLTLDGTDFINLTLEDKYKVYLEVKEMILK